MTAPGSTLQALMLTQPPIAPYALGSGCHEKDLDPRLAAIFEKAPAEAFVIIARDGDNIVIQTREGVRRANLQDLREITVNPVLPAKGAGMVMFFFGAKEDREPDLWEFVWYPVYSEELKSWCLGTAQVIAQMLELPVKVAEPSHDC